MSSVDRRGARPVLPQSGSLAETEASIAHLAARLELLEDRVALAVARHRARRAGGADERWRGLFLSDAEVDALLAAPPEGLLGSHAEGGNHQVEAAVDAAEGAGVTSRLRLLQHRFGLDELDLDLLLAAVAPELDRRFEQLYAYLNDDLTRRRPTIGLALELCGAGPMDHHARDALGAAGRLVPVGLVVVEDEDRPFLSRGLRAPDRVGAFLLGSDVVDPAVEACLVPVIPWSVEESGSVVDALRAGERICYARERPGASGVSFFGASLNAVGLGALAVDAAFISTSGGLAGLVPSILREAGLQGAGLVLEHADELARREPRALRGICEAPAVVCLVGRSSWDPEWAHILPHAIEIGPPPVSARRGLWQAVLGDDAPADEAPGMERVAALRMTPLHVVNVVGAARRRAANEARRLALADLETGIRSIGAAPLEQLSTRRTPHATWNDIVLAPPIARGVRKVAARARHRELVQDIWGVAGASGRRGTIAMFSGPPGTGKTLAAEVIAGELGVDLYVIDLATVVDKYIGETEKNLERIFRAAEEVNALLFFDEADAIFGKRSEVKDARDRYANVEVAYLLQRLERIDGVVILATNLSSNVDEAFARRLDVSVDFRLPGIAERLALWAMSLPETLPQSQDVDLAFMADAFALSGSSIRNICVEAAHLAADSVGEVTMECLIRAAALEHRKLGLLVAAGDFRQYLDIAQLELAS